MKTREVSFGGRRSIGLFGTIVLVALALLFLFPFYWMLSTAFRPQGQVYVVPPHWLPVINDVSNFRGVLQVFPFGRYFWNTLYSSTLSAIGQTACSALAAYAFARMHWRGRNIFVGVTISTMMIPPAVFAIPWYILYWRIGILGTLMPLWLPYWFQHPYIIFLLTQFFRGIPRTLDDAARIDGASDFVIFARVTLPLSRPALFTALLLHFIFMWKNLLVPLMYINDDRLFTLSVGLQTILGGTVKPPFNQVMAAAFLASAPLVAVFLACRKSIFSGIAVSSFK